MFLVTMLKPSIEFAALAVFGVLLTAGAADGAEPGRPNVLLLLVDDLKPALGCYGDPAARTPNLDALAARGMRFDLAYCNQAVCAPSRFTLMLGSHSTSTGLYHLGSRLREILPEAVTMPQYFARHGYRTESLGKVYHIGHGNEGDPRSFSVPHFGEKVIEYLLPESTPGGKLTREEAMFGNRKVGDFNALPRGAAYEWPEVEDTAYADGRIAEETVKRLRAARERLKNEGTPFLSPPGSPVRICPSARRRNTGISTIRIVCRCRRTRICRQVRPRWPTSAAARSRTIFRDRTRGIPRRFPMR